MLFHVTDFAGLITFWLFKFIFRNELQKAKKYFASVLSFISLAYRTWKNSGFYLTGMGLALWYIGHGFKKYSNYLTGLGWFFVILDLKSARTTFTGVRLILWYSGRGLKNTWTSWLDSDFIIHWAWVVDWLNELIKQSSH